MKNPTLCVIFGGKSSEYEVSLRSAYSVLEHLNKEKYEIIRLGITKDGEWYVFEGENEKILSDTWQGKACVPVTVDLSSSRLIMLGDANRYVHIDLFLPILHGGYGEDGRIQGLFDIVGVRYVGCDAFASHICMDKRLTKMIASVYGVPVAKTLINSKCEIQNMKFGAEFTYPVFVKPAMGGSSVGVFKVEEQGGVEEAFLSALEYGDVVVEEFIDGCEVEVGVLELGGEIVISPVGMIRHGGRFYDYETKYQCEENEYLIPAPIEEKVSSRVREYAKKLFVALGCGGLGRFDFFVKKNGDVVFNEVNTLPGFTDISMFPKLFMSMGYGYGELLDVIIENALRSKKYKAQNSK